MKFKNLFSITHNKRNDQINLSLKKKKLKEIGMTPEELFELTMPKPKTKFYKK